MRQDDWNPPPIDELWWITYEYQKLPYAKEIYSAIHVSQYLITRAITAKDVRKIGWNTHWENNTELRREEEGRKNFQQCRRAHCLSNCRKLCGTWSLLPDLDLFSNRRLKWEIKFKALWRTWERTSTSVTQMFSCRKQGQTGREHFTTALVDIRMHKAFLVPLHKESL